MYRRKVVGSLAIKLKMDIKALNAHHPFPRPTTSPLWEIQMMSWMMDKKLTITAIRVGSTSSGRVMLISRHRKNTRLTKLELCQNSFREILLKFVRCILTWLPHVKPENMSKTKWTMNTILRFFLVISIIIVFFLFQVLLFNC